MYLFKVSISFYFYRQKQFKNEFSLDGRSLFTKEIYPKIFKQTGIHFFNLPCQTTSWYPRISCPSKSCNTPVCDRKDLCIPVYYTPANVKAEVD
jgi:hypothetical protein